MSCALSELLFLSIICATVERFQGDSRCSGNQITWIHETSGHVIGCSPCPACPPGTEYSIPCSTRAVNGTPAKCVSCPRRKFSTRFDTKPCVACTRCSKRYTKKVCTPHGNAICGGCIAGYHDNKISFSCDECVRCCHDGKDQAPPGCARVGMCKPRPYGCPNLSSTRRTKPTANWTVKESNASKIFTRKIKTFQSRSATKARTSSSPTKLFHKTYFTLAQVVRHEDITSSQTLMYVLLGLFILILLILLAVAAIYKPFNKIHRPELARTLSSSYSTTPFMPVPTPEDRTLEDFVENGHDVVDSVCLLLYDKRREGIWDFERVALRFGLTQEERIAIKSQIHIDGGNPTRELLQILCHKRPKITVKQFAETVKCIKRNEVYEKLVSFFSN